MKNLFLIIGALFSLNSFAGEVPALSADTSWNGQMMTAIVQTAGRGMPSGNDAEVILKLVVTEGEVYRTVKLDFVEIRPDGDKLVEQDLVSHCYNLNVKQLISDNLVLQPYKPLRIQLPDALLNNSMIPPSAGCRSGDYLTSVKVIIVR